MRLRPSAGLLSKSKHKTLNFDSLFNPKIRVFRHPPSSWTELLSSWLFRLLFDLVLLASLRVSIIISSEAPELLQPGTSSFYLQILKFMAGTSSASACATQRARVRDCRRARRSALAVDRKTTEPDRKTEPIRNRNEQKSADVRELCRCARATCATRQCGRHVAHVAHAWRGGRNVKRRWSEVNPPTHTHTHERLQIPPQVIKVTCARSRDRCSLSSAHLECCRARANAQTTFEKPQRSDEVITAGSAPPPPQHRLA